MLVKLVQLLISIKALDAVFGGYFEEEEGEEEENEKTSPLVEEGETKSSLSPLEYSRRRGSMRQERRFSPEIVADSPTPRGNDAADRDAAKTTEKRDAFDKG